MKFKLSLLFASQLIMQISLAQTGKYLVLFKDKNNNTFSTSNPLAFVNQRSIDRRIKQNIPFTIDDLPPTQTYIDGLKGINGVTIWFKSRWANAALVLMDKSLEASVLALPFVKGFENNGPLDLKANGQPGAKKANKFDVNLENVNHGNATTQVNMLGLQHLHNASFKGEGKLIAVLDDGFNSVNLDTYLANLFAQNRVVDHYDFIRNTPTVYDVGGHGNLVLSTMAANVNGSFIGTAPQAQYALFRTEYAPDERIIEEANYLFGCERADSLGADIINSSLGYGHYDYIPYSHVTTDYNGDKTLVTRSADWAARAGILLCTSAGNSGNLGIFAPADADSVLAVGAVTSAEIKSSFSSIGPSADGRIKPDVSAMGSSSTVSYYSQSSSQSILATASGTSFSSPIMAGFVACFWQANPELNNMQAIAAIKSIGTLSANPNNNLGWGIPKFPDLIIANDQDSRTKVMQQGIPNSFLTTTNSRILLQVLPNGVSPLTGTVFSKITIDPAVQMVDNKPTITRHFEITPLNSQNSTAKITLFVSQTEFNLYNANNSGFNDIPSNSIDNTAKENIRVLQKHKLPDNSFEYLLLDPIDSEIVWNTIENIWEISVNVVGFSEFYITSTPITVLPLKLISFNVKAEQTLNKIEWEVEKRTNFSHFEVQKSADALAFLKIGDVLANEVFFENEKYTFFDNSVQSNLINYYRLKMVDKDGKFEFSKIISLKNIAIDWIKIKQNPISGQLELLLNENQNANFQIQISDIFGKVLYENSIINCNKLIINTLNWVNGEYVVQVFNNEFKKSIKFLKQ